MISPRQAALIVAAVVLVAGASWFLIPRAGPVVAVPGAPESPCSAAATEPRKATDPVSAAETDSQLKDLTTDSELIEKRFGLDEPRRDQPMPPKLFREDADKQDALAEESPGMGGSLGGSRGRKPRMDPPAEASPAQLWLAAQQNREGYFSAEVPTPEAKPATPSIFCTALAMLANVHVGATHKEGPTRAMVRQAVLWARKIQDNDGSLDHEETVDPLLHHAAATYAIVETYAMAGDVVLKPIADKAIDYLLKSKGVFSAWGMTPQASDPNVVVTGWALLALDAARKAGLKFDEQVFAEVAVWVWSLRRAERTA